jgi:hypothetical protein
VESGQFETALELPIAIFGEFFGAMATEKLRSSQIHSNKHLISSNNKQ